MAAFGQDFLKGFFGSDYLKDYKHASNTFRSAGYELAPRFKYLYHVFFTLNTVEIPTLRTVFDVNSQSRLGLLCKSAELPSYSIDNETLVQYNRKRVVQTRINYDPVTLVMHDDSSDLSRKLWYNYYSYYYKDPSQKYNGVPTSDGTAGPSTTPAGFAYNDRNIYKNDLAVNDWGFIGESYTDSTNSAGGKPNFFRDITIFGFSRKQYFSYTLINPVITSFKHDTYDYSQDAGIMENAMQIAYETVKYGSGAISSGQVPGFADPSYYDTEPSPLTSAGGTNSVLGSGGILESGAGIFSDLQSGNFLGAIQKGGATAGAFKNIGGPGGLFRTLRGELQTNAVSALRSNDFKQGIRNGISTLQPNTNTITNTVVGSIKKFSNGSDT